MTYRDDPLLGRVRLCSACGDEWPFDAEFWHMRDGGLSPAWPARCIACCAEYYAAKRRLAMTLERAERVFLIPDSSRCGTALRGGRYCGRKPGHSTEHRSMETVAAEAQRRRDKRAAA